MFPLFVNSTNEKYEITKKVSQQQNHQANLFEEQSPLSIHEVVVSVFQLVSQQRP